MYMLIYLLPLFIVLAIETPIYFEFLKRKNILSLVLIIVMNIISNLSFNLAYVYTDYSNLTLIFGEIIVFVLEGLLLSLAFNDFRYFIYSFIANILSLLIGLFINRFLNLYESELIISVAVFASLFALYMIIRIISLYVSKKEKVKIV